MTKIESRDFALIFSGKRPFNTLSKMELSDIVIVTMDFYLHSAQEMLILSVILPSKNEIFFVYFCCFVDAIIFVVGLLRSMLL